MEQMTQAVKETATDEGSALTTEQALQQPASAVVAGQVSQTEIKASENTAKAEIVPGDQQVTVESTDTVTASTGTDSGQDTPDSQAEQLTQNSVQMMENYSKQAKAAENSSAAAPEAEQEVPAAPITAASGSSHPLDEGSFKVNTERAATPSQAQDIRQQVVRQLSTSLDGKIGQEKVVLHLNPEKLGQVEIQFVAKGNDLNIVISAQSGEAEKAIKEGIRELASGISDKSTRWQQVDIKVENRGQDADKNDTRNDERRDQSRQEQSASHHQEHQHRRPDGRPDWASLRGEG
jgi:flagellar hook-length control protein FliK